ncbi:MAG: NAD(P)(+) transhydrogenase (Re/Si-specific) subunit beta [Planctomycetales bacterium]
MTSESIHQLINFFYLVSAVMFILGVKGLTHPRSAVRGNLLAAGGMLTAILVTLVNPDIVAWRWGYIWIIIGVGIGAAIGAALAIKIKIEDMPQLVALFNGFGGIASALVAGAALSWAYFDGKEGGVGLAFGISAALSGLIGAVTFTGSLVAFGKLQGLIKEGFLLFPGRQWVTLAGALLILGLCVVMAPVSDHGFGIFLYWVIVILAMALGLMLVVPIGGADMPVVIALLNSYSGLAAAATGFVINNNVLIISGSLVGASGLILTKIMCKAMNRSLVNVIFGGLGTQASSVADADDVYEGKIKSTSADEVAMMLESARRVVIVPGYGMAVAQAQHGVRVLTDLLVAKDIEVEFGVHPVAGRMPGHMNVLLAEAEIEYERLKDMDEINPTFAQTDVVIIIGANDVVNPVARTDPNSPIAGMPVLNVDQARTAVIIKRSLSPGFAGIPNPLFAADNSLMFLEDGKKAVLQIVEAFKEL